MAAEMTQLATTRFRDHPPGLKYLFFAEMWERFSYYGMRAMLVFYMTTDLLYSHDNAYGIYGTYTALVYTTPIIGGLLADRILGDRKAIFFGGILIALGHLSLTFSTEWMFFIGLAFIISGTGLFKANVSALLGKLYQHGDPRRDAGFTLFYVGINLGSFTAALACGWIGKTYGWHYGFGLAAIGMLTGLLFFVRGLPSLEGQRKYLRFELGTNDLCYSLHVGADYSSYGHESRTLQLFYVGSWCGCNHLYALFGFFFAWGRTSKYFNYPGIDVLFYEFLCHV
jgi:amino acid/peptide:H+ symporter